MWKEPTDLRLNPLRHNAFEHSKSPNTGHTDTLSRPVAAVYLSRHLLSVCVLHTAVSDPRCQYMPDSLHR